MVHDGEPADARPSSRSWWRRRAPPRDFRPGQFYRLQNFETLAPIRRHGTALAMEGLALTGAWTDTEQRAGVGLIVLEMGGSSDLCALLQPGEPVILMGPTGTPTEIPAGETVLLVGGGLGNAVLFSIGAALRRRARRWSTSPATRRCTTATRWRRSSGRRCGHLVLRRGAGLRAGPAAGPQLRRQHRAGDGGLRARASWGHADADQEVDRIDRHRLGPHDAGGGAARHGVLAPYLKPGTCAIGSINSPMQCMMKEVCAQCLQPHNDPVTGEETVVFSCFNQDQALDRVDFAGAARAPAAERRAGEADRAMDRPLPEGTPVATAFTVNRVLVGLKRPDLRLLLCRSGLLSPTSISSNPIRATASVTSSPHLRYPP